jgi:hypothetical protein
VIDWVSQQNRAVKGKAHRIVEPLPQRASPAAACGAQSARALSLVAETGETAPVVAAVAAAAIPRGRGVDAIADGRVAVIELEVGRSSEAAPVWFGVCAAATLRRAGCCGCEPARSGSKDVGLLVEAQKRSSVAAGCLAKPCLPKPSSDIPNRSECASNARRISFCFSESRSAMRSIATVPSEVFCTCGRGAKRLRAWVEDICAVSRKQTGKA